MRSLGRCAMLSFSVFICLVGLALLVQPPAAAAAENECKGKACIDFGDAFSKDTPPMDKSMKGKVNSRRHKEKKEKKIHPQCVRGLEENDEEKIAKFCDKSPGKERKDSKKEDIVIGGKKRGKKIKNKTVVRYRDAKQRYGHQKRDKWENLVFKQPQTGDLTRRVYKNKTNTTDKTRKKMFLTDDDPSANDDRDCVDRVTGNHVGGPGVGDGAPDSCFDGSGALKLVTPVPDGCEHYAFLVGAPDFQDDDCYDVNNVLKPDRTAVPGGCVRTFFFTGAPDGVEDECYDEANALKSKLEELIDEDGYSPDNDGDGTDFDVDGDGFDGEDPPNPGTDPVNDDRDCVDTATGRHLGGFDEFGVLIPDGNEDSCFDAFGALKQTLSPAFFGCSGTGDPDELAYDPYDGVADTCFDMYGNPVAGTPEPQGCKHGTFFDGAPDGVEDDCYYADNALKPGMTPAEGGGCYEYLFFDGDPEGTFFAGAPDGAEDDCYYADNTLKPNMTATEGGCLKAVEDECYDAAGQLRTTLAELVDEDDGLPIDDDGDGLVDEDPGVLDDYDPANEADNFKNACYAKAKHISGKDDIDTTGMYTEDGGCDLTRAAIVNVNKFCEQNSSKNEKCFKADDDGYEDETAAPNGNTYGQEERQVEIDEDFTVMCDEGMQLDDVTGQCVPDEQVAALAAYRDSLARNGLPVTASTTDAGYVMMGFTFAPPKVRWGLFYKEEVCFSLIFTDICITLFEARIGYDFGIGVGFRLPMEATVSNLPGASILAEDEMDLLTRIEPEDFSVQQYKDFCTHYDMGDAAFCSRFSFPDALLPEDGDELAIRLRAFAGLVVKILSIPLINWGVDVDMDLPELCSLYLAMNEDPLLLAEELGRQGGNFGKAVKALGLNCGSYTTPFGNDDEGEPLQFPFISNAPFVNQMVRADCAEAFARGETIKLPDGEVYPLCTGLILGVHGASLGLGLGVDLEMNSNLIDATASVRGDGVFRDLDPGAEQKVDIHYPAASAGGSQTVPIDTIRVDNYDDSETEDYARVVLNDFTYCLNTFSIRLKGQAMFGGILTIFPDFPDFTIYRFTVPVVDEICFIPIGQHSGTGEGYEVPVLVENYGLEVSVTTDPDDPNYVDGKTLTFPYDKNEPGGEFIVSVKNLGSFQGDFDNFDHELTNRRVEEQTAPYTFLINPNSDFDCTTSGGAILRGDPYDGIADDCFTAAGTVQPGMTEQSDEDDFGPQGALREERDEDKDGLADEDPPDDWQTDPAQGVFNGQLIANVPAHDIPAPGATLTLKVLPFVHPTTRPGVYPFRVTADSKDAKTFSLSAIDPSGNYRVGASDVAYVEVVAFYEPRVAVQPAAPSGKPGVVQLYTVEGTNMGNVDDTMSLALTFLDFNVAGCTLTTLGTDPDCPYRAVPTIIPEAEWTTAGGLALQFGPLEPLGVDNDTFTILVPADWAGMEDTVYQFTAKVVSLVDPSEPAAEDTVLVEQTVIATKESMTRYVDLEIDELIAEIEAANAAGIKTGGLLPISAHPAKQKVEQALDLILKGKFDQATNALESAIKVMEAFVHALDGYNGKGTKIPPEMDSDWHVRAQAIIGDLEAAAASTVSS